MNRQDIEDALASERLERGWKACLKTVFTASVEQKAEALNWIHERRQAIFWAIEEMQGINLTEIYELSYAQLCHYRNLMETQCGRGIETTLRTLLLTSLLEAMEEPMAFSTVNQIHTSFALKSISRSVTQEMLPLAA